MSRSALSFANVTQQAATGRPSTGPFLSLPLMVRPRGYIIRLFEVRSRSWICACLIIQRPDLAKAWLFDSDKSKIGRRTLLTTSRPREQIELLKVDLRLPVQPFVNPGSHKKR